MDGDTHVGSQVLLFRKLEKDMREHNLTVDNMKKDPVPTGIFLHLKAALTMSDLLWQVQPPSRSSIPDLEPQELEVSSVFVEKILKGKPDVDLDFLFKC